jgi:class 3 adenylate cyclase/ABC-type transport system involved in cytochrome c biogenesis ATPase subunit
LRLAVAGRAAEPFDRSIDMLIARLRRKIEPDPKVPRFLVTVPGVGYKLVVRTPPAESEKLGAEKLGAERTDPERRQITAVCCNLVGAMGLAANLDPEDLSHISRHFQSAVVAAITGLGGTIAVVGPDEILAFFGLPEAHEDDAERAVSAGLEAMANIARLLSSNGAPLQARVGIATGLALASSRAAVGVPSVMATGVCNLAPPNSVVVTASTRRLLSGAFVCGDPERYELAGLPEAVSVCSVKRKRAITSRFRAKHPNKITRNVGRDHELQQLSALWDRAKRGDGQVAFVCGDAGIGKSHLCEFLLGRLAKEPHATLRYQCSPNYLSSPLYPVIRQLEHAVRFKRRDTAAARYEKLKAALSQIVQPTAADMSAYASLLSIGPAEHEQLPGLDPQRQKDLAIAALIPLLLKLATRQPLIILLEDAHWIDPSSLELLDRIIPVIKAARVLLLITFRPEFITQWPNDPHVTLLRLNRMGHDESHALISQVTTEKLPPAIEEQIIDRADGIPLFVEELTKTAVKSEAIQNITVRNIAADHRPMLAIPPTLLDSLTGRLDLLGPAKEIAQIGAVIGREFSELLLAAVAPESAESMRTGLAQLVASGMVFVNKDPDVTYTFKHGLVRDAAYATLSRAKRQRLHAGIADALESNFRLIVQTQPELLAHHLAEAGLTERAIYYLRKAAQKLEQNVPGDSRRRERHQERQGGDNQRVAAGRPRYSNGQRFSAEMVARR